MKTVIIKVIEWLYLTLRGRPITESQAFNPEKVAIIGETIFVNLLVTMTLSLVALIVFAKKKSWLSKAALMITVIDLFLFSRGNLITIPVKLVGEPRKVASWLSKQKGDWRYLSTAGTTPYTGLGVYWTHLRAREPFSPNNLTEEELIHFTRLKQELEALPENQGMTLRLPDAAGYAAAVPQRYLSFWSGDPRSPNAIPVDDLSSEKLDKLGVRYLLTGYPEDYILPLASEKFTLIEKSKGLRVYENKSAFPRAFLEDGALIIPAEIIEYTPTMIRVRTKAQEKTTLILSDTFYPGWEALVDGERTTVGAYEGVFRKVNIPAGVHEVDFVYNPKSVKVGAIISLGTALLLIIGWKKDRKLRSFFSTSTARRTRLNV
ncbi:MAG: hypothetical protein A2900_03140 [Candidatus Chisholmbacteria bacterium RIFCSPLOWO2_01_FULL_50_28]|uniref:Bacterial membrane protein YfhO n=1 Tax=Candidatus Chisholmbacteria bacterium RIFCSPHIGHO2_01_FULL_52_32 TaxID=1797591 RepID=A0A1G1VT24_9BACT|nr:MAG: hypothetical protein A2786_03605 [Candidatus Chisholmbacteria bacterium RIFCSPHIGHO2_01_FULL_52_32]OGY20071.1 MAG: hypothetical protein A2900_03140 [Candidatus Chisholmbacteria bacterium RIFCSPLOWO2_01_FULL_50_28]